MIGLGGWIHPNGTYYALPGIDNHWEYAATLAKNIHGKDFDLANDSDTYDAYEFLFSMGWVRYTNGNLLEFSQDNAKDAVIEFIRAHKMKDAIRVWRTRDGGGTHCAELWDGIGSKFLEQDIL